jgi:hypothetical protein
MREWAVSMMVTRTCSSVASASMADHVGAGGHDLRDRRVVKLDDRLDHLAFLLVDNAAFLALFHRRENLVLYLLLDLLGLGGDISAATDRTNASLARMTQSSGIIATRSVSRNVAVDPTTTLPA